MKKIFALLTMMLLITAAMFAQTDSTQAPTTGTGAVGWITSNYVLVFSIIYGLYELIARYVPTVKNYSIVSLVIKIIQALVPNVSAKGGTHE